MNALSNYDKNVFINCPFDNDYEDLFNAILFAVHRCGFILRCAKEFEDSSSIRIQNIISLIDQSNYAIHDLSRVSTNQISALPRFNMPLELGIFIGCNSFGGKRHKQKEYLVIESEQFRFKEFISDLSGQDIKSHKNDPKTAIKCIRNWLTKKNSDSVPSPTVIWSEYREFLDALPDLCQESQWIVEELTFEEFSTLVTNWIALGEPVEE